MIVQLLVYNYGLFGMMGADRNDYELNGNMTLRNKHETWYQLMTWDSHNPLAKMSGAGVSGATLNRLAPFPAPPTPAARR